MASRATSLINPEVLEEYCKKYEIEKQHELPALVKASKRRLHQMRRDSQDETLGSVEERIKRKHFDNFIEQYFKGCTADESRYLFSTMDAEFKAGDNYSDLEHCLHAFLKGGLDGVRSQRSKDTHNRRIKSGLRAIWTVFKGLVEIAVVLGIYSALQTPFETITISILLVIYSIVALHTSTSAVRWTSGVIKGDAQFCDLRTILGKPVDAYLLEESGKISRNLKAQQVAILIYQFTLGAVDLIALWKIVRVIGWL